MEQILYIRETFIGFYKRFETALLFLARFFIGIFIFSIINSIGYSLDIFSTLNTSPYNVPYILLMGLFFAITPTTFGYGLIIINIGIQTSQSMGIMMFLVSFLLCLLFFYARLAPKESLLILAVYIAFYFKVPFLVPIIAGLYLGLTSIIPITIGILIWEFAPFFSALLEETKDMNVSIMEMPVEFSNLYISIINDISANEKWIFTAFIFAMIVLVVYITSHISVDYSKDLAIGAGAVLAIISFIIAVLVIDMEVGLLGVVVSAVFSCLIAYIIKFFDIVLDYQRVERVQFEDETNYYYVKIVPKVVFASKKKKGAIKRIRSNENPNEDADYGLYEQREDFDEYSEYDGFDAYDKGKESNYEERENFNKEKNNNKYKKPRRI